MKMIKETIACAMLLMASVVQAQATASTDSLLNDSVWKDVELEDVTVKAQKPLVKMKTDRMEYDVASDVDSKSSTVLDMLRKVPMVTVDGNDNITVNGSSSFKVYVDGKPNAMLSGNPSMAFKNMPASAVKSIEVITNPGAKYDAEGAGGILNLTMNKMEGQAASTDGYTGTVRLQTGTKEYGGGTFFSMQQGKFSMNVNVYYNNQHLGNLENETEREQLSAEGQGMMKSLNDVDNRNRFGMANVSAGYEFDSLRTLNASVGYMGWTNRQHIDGKTDFRGNLYGGNFGYQSLLDVKERENSLNVSADYTRKFASNSDRQFVLSYLFTNTPGDNTQRSVYGQMPAGTFYDLADRYSDSHTRATENTIQVDYIEPLAVGHKLELGAKYVNRRNSSNAKFYVMDGDADILKEDLGTRYRHLNNIVAGYAQYNGTFGKLGTKAGLRYEHTWQEVRYEQGSGESFHLDFGNLVPTADVSYRLTDTQNVGLTYNMRISRPGISYLNPYVDRSSVGSITYGNSDLDVEKRHNVSLVYNYFTMKFMLNLTLRQSFCNNAIEQYSFYDTDNLLNTTYGNVVKERNSSLNVFVNYAPWAKTRITLNGGVAYKDFHSARLAQNNHGWQANTMLGVQQTLPWSLKASLNLIANSKNHTLQGWSSGFDLGILSLTKSMLKDKLSVSLVGATSLKGKNLEFNTSSAGRDFRQHSFTTVPIRMAVVSVSWTFGKNGYQAKQQQGRIQRDVKDKQQQGSELNSVLGR